MLESMWAEIGDVCDRLRQPMKGRGNCVKVTGEPFPPGVEKTDGVRGRAPIDGN